MRASNRLLICGLLLGFWASATLASVQGTLYGVGGSGSNFGLITIDPTTGVATEVIGRVDYEREVTLDDITGETFIATAGDPFTSLTDDGMGGLFAVDVFNVLVKIDPTTGAGTTVGRLGGVSVIRALASDGMGGLFGISSSSDLVAIDPATAAATIIGPTGFGGIQSLASDGMGGLFSVHTRTSSVISIDPATGAGTVVFTAARANEISYGLASDGMGNLLAVYDSLLGDSGPDLFLLVPEFEADVYVGDIRYADGRTLGASDVQGLAFVPAGTGAIPDQGGAIPEAASYLTWVGLLGIAAASSWRIFGTRALRGTQDQVVASRPCLRDSDHRLTQKAKKPIGCSSVSLAQSPGDGSIVVDEGHLMR